MTTKECLLETSHLDFLRCDSDCAGLTKKLLFLLGTLAGEVLKEGSDIAEIENTEDAECTYVKKDTNSKAVPEKMYGCL